MVGFHSLTPVGGLYERVCVCVFKYVCVLFIYLSLFFYFNFYYGLNDVLFVMWKKKAELYLQGSVITLVVFK